MTGQPPPIHPHSPPDLPENERGAETFTTWIRKQKMLVAFSVLALLSMTFIGLVASDNLMRIATQKFNANRSEAAGVPTQPPETRNEKADERITEAIPLANENTSKNPALKTDETEGRTAEPPEWPAKDQLKDRSTPLPTSQPKSDAHIKPDDPPANVPNPPSTPRDTALRVFNVNKRKSLPKWGRNPFLLATQAESTVFVIDKSSSMQGESFHLVSEALLGALNKLKQDQSFSIIFFDNVALQLQPAMLLTNNKRNKHAAEEFVAAQTPSGGTQPYTAISLALSLAPESIIVLSDGDFAISAVEKITQANLLHNRTTIHCIGLDHNIPTLEQLAKENGGTYNTANTSSQLLESSVPTSSTH